MKKLLIKQTVMLASCVAISFSQISLAKNSLLELDGKWTCNQVDTITDSVKGENQYTVFYQKNSNRVTQSGKVKIIDSTRLLESSLTYEIDFEYFNRGTKFENTLKGIEYKVLSDQLNVLTNGITGLFPEIGETMKSEVTVLENGNLRNIHDSGAVTECLKIWPDH